MNYPFALYSTADSFIDKIESNSSGHYPIGTSIFWHSGIHIFCDTQKEFNPILNGNVVCYRISPNYKQVKLPECLAEEELSEKWADYKDSYKNGRIKDSDKEKTYPISDCFIMLEHSITINKKKFTFYSLYMNLAPKCDNPNYHKSLKIDGRIHGHSINATEDVFMIDKIGLPAKDKKDIYFDFAILSKESIKEFSSKTGKEVFFSIKENISLYKMLLTESSDFEEIEMPKWVTFTSEKHTLADKISYKIKLTHVQVYFPATSKFTEGVLSENDISAAYLSTSSKFIKDYVDPVLTKFKGKKVEIITGNVKETEYNSTIYINKRDTFSYIKLKFQEPVVIWTTEPLKNQTNNKNVTDKDHPIVKKYNSNPFACNFEKIIESADKLKAEIIDIKQPPSDNSETNYYEVVFKNPNNEKVFISESDKNNCFEFATDFEKWFHFYKETNSIICDKTDLANYSIKKHDDNIRKLKLFAPIIGIWWPGAILTWALIKYMYGKLSSENNSKGGMLTKQEFRKIVCSHPIEWDKNQFANLDEKAVGKIIKNRLINESSAIDLWKDGLSKIFTSTPYFYHPIYFLNHLEKAGLFEFNPYEGLTYSDIYKGTVNKVFDRTKPDGDKKTNKITLPTDWTVISNPGFAPYLGEGNGINGYGKVTGLFNEDYLQVTRFTIDGVKYPYSVYRNYYYHFGLDFSGSSGDPIISLIYGRVIAKCWISSNGRCLLIQGKTTNNLYMLCHLKSYSENLKEGDEVFPGKEVAKVGTSGGSSGSYSETSFAGSDHLHLSVIKWNTANIKKTDILEARSEISIKGGGKETHYNLKSRTYLDPFNYKYEGGWMENKTNDDESSRSLLEKNYRNSLKS